MSNTLWSKLKTHSAEISALSLRTLFQKMPNRAQRFSLQTCGITLDYSKNRITDTTLNELLALADQHHLTKHIQAMFNGAEVNPTEHRPALHTALRRLHHFESLEVNGVDVMPNVRQQLEKMRALVSAIHSGSWQGYSGKKITDVVNIGIGGSDLGPRMVVKALTPYHVTAVRCHFVANVDATDLMEVLKGLNPETTLFIVASKSFTTQETLMNAETARSWLLNKAQQPQAVSQHFVAISSKPDKAKAFGINPDNVFEMWDWVGGRYSLWSTIGLPIALAIGMSGFEQLLTGAEQMDGHFKTSPLSQNMPVILGLLGIWYIQGFGCQSQAVIPYDEFLQLLPNYLQQLDMESNGKSVMVNGAPVTHGTAPILWGGIGTNGQHAFHQLLHQGTVMVPVDFIVAARSHHPVGQHHAALYANCLAQSQALMQGKTLPEAMAELLAEGKSLAEAESLAPHKVIAGNKPSNTLVLEQLTPKTLGALLALYEHKVFVQSVLWQINAFDQWGVELGKQLSGPILARLQKLSIATPLDSSTERLIAHFHRAPHPWIILDRDGVINQDSEHYIKSVEEWQPIPRSLSAIARLNRASLMVGVATNQSGLARGLYDEATLAAMHRKFYHLLSVEGGYVDALVYCPHHPDDHCECRKPKIGLLQQLSTQLRLPLSEAIFVGDHYKDIETARRAGCRAVLVKTGKGQETLAAHPELVTEGVSVYSDLSEFVDHLLRSLC